MSDSTIYMTGLAVRCHIIQLIRKFRLIFADYLRNMLRIKMAESSKNLTNN